MRVRPTDPRADQGRRVFLGAAAALLSGGSALAQTAGPTALRPGAPDNQTDALTRALTAATRAGRPLRLAPGRYRIDGLVPPPGARLTGEATLVQGGPGPIIAAAGPGSFSLSDVTLQGDPAGDPARPLLQASDISDIDISRVSMAGTRGVALRLERCGGRVERCRIANADVGIHSLDATGLTIFGNDVRNCSNNGIQVWRSSAGHDGTQVLSNRVDGIAARAGGSGEYGNGVNVFRAGNVMVAQNAIRNCDFSAVRGNAASNIQILGNHCTRLREVAIFVEFGFEGAVVANNVADSASAGISVTNFDHGGRLATVTGNLVRNLFRRPDPLTGKINQGYGIAAEADTLVSGNVVEGAEFAGLLLGYGPYLRDVVCANNLVRASGVGIAVSVAPGAGAAQITGNTVAGCKTALVGFAWDEPVAPDLLGSTARFPQLTLAGNVIR